VGTGLLDRIRPILKTDYPRISCSGSYDGPLAERFEADLLAFRTVA
jgi:hypothetical protein